MATREYRLFHFDNLLIYYRFYLSSFGLALYSTTCSRRKHVASRWATFFLFTNILSSITGSPRRSVRDPIASAVPASSTADTLTSMMQSLSTTDRVHQLLLEYLGNTSCNQRGQYACYVVYRGRVSGVFNAWFEAHESVNGVSGNVYKGFRTRDEGDASYRAWLAFLERRMHQATVHSETTTTVSYSPVSDPQAPAPAPMSTVTPHPSEGVGSNSGRSSSPTLSDDAVFLNLAELPRYYLVLRGERPGVYDTILAADAALGNAPDALIRRLLGDELSAYRQFARLSESRQVFTV
ncbi:hypothetical protein F5887DRAFT_1083315 [Amanita rubescens]|nr:hypothetical protein F5887DRAFT_1083315 [Amanita rubescens]